MENLNSSSPVKAKNQHAMPPNERTVRFLVKIVEWIKSIVSSTGLERPTGQVIELHDKNCPAGKSLSFPRIMLVEDNPDIAADFITTLRNYYKYGKVMVFIAYGFAGALSFFNAEDISLVIMDADLDDKEGDGVELTQQFIARKPGVVILANSSSKLSNMKLTGYGAVGVIGKDQSNLAQWLQENDPTGTGN
jgi:CheY-like chemotaxis protein